MYIQINMLCNTDNDVLDFIRNLFSTDYFPPKWYAGYWTNFHGWLYICSDIALWSAFFAIPIIILKYINQRPTSKLVKIYSFFAAFILATGSIFLLDFISFWAPFYRLEALLKLFAAIISWCTIYYLVRILPDASKMRSANEFEKEIEARKEIEERLKLNNKLLSDAQEIAKLGHWLWDVTSNKVEWSDMTLRLFGIESIENMDYDTYLNHIHPDDRTLVHNNITNALIYKKFPTFYHRIILPDGSIRTILGRGEVVLDQEGNVSKLIGTAQDVTEQVNTEQELIIKTQKLEASNEELQKFASIASHDLREPLRKIITFGTMLEKEAGATLSEKSTIYLDKITSSANRMQQLIQDILDFSKLTVNQYQFIKTPLNDVIKDVLSDMEVNISISKAIINVDPLPAIECIPGQMAQLFQNLISNAIKFQKKDEIAKISISCEFTNVHTVTSIKNELQSIYSNVSDSKEPNTFCIIKIADNGIGFNEEYQDKIFLLFQRLHSTSEYEGTGIGLAICKKIIDFHNGHIQAMSVEGKGTTFYLYLPITQPNSPIKHIYN